MDKWMILLQLILFQNGSVTAGCQASDEKDLETLTLNGIQTNEVKNVKHLSQGH